MADGDFDVKVLIKSRLPGGGHGLAAGASNDKIEVVASVTGTYNTAGIVIAPKDFGLRKIDALFTSQVHINNDTAPTATNPSGAVFIARSGDTGNLVFVLHSTGQAEATDSQTFSCTILAYGDGAAAPNFS